MILIMQTTVRDFDTWKSGFDLGEPLRVKHGCLGHVILRHDDDASAITIHLRFPSRQAADGFLADPQFAANLEKAGVQGKPAVTPAHEEETQLYVNTVAA
jgi:hypothetical protein